MVKLKRITRRIQQQALKNVDAILICGDYVSADIIKSGNNKGKIRVNFEDTITFLNPSVVPANVKRSIHYITYFRTFTAVFVPPRSLQDMKCKNIMKMGTEDFAGVTLPELVKNINETLKVNLNKVYFVYGMSEKDSKLPMLNWNSKLIKAGEEYIQYSMYSHLIRAPKLKFRKML